MKFISINIVDTTPSRILGTPLLFCEKEGKSSYSFVEIFSQTLIEMKKFLLLDRRSTPDESGGRWLTILSRKSNRI